MSNPDDLSVIGRRQPRLDGFDKVSGRSVFTDDIVLPGMLHGRILRSPHSRARIVSIDTSKALALPGVPLDPEVSRTWLALACAGAAVVGHCYPVWFDFKGGKGAATAIGALLAIAPALTFPALVVWCLVLTATGFVGLATMLAAAVLPVWVALTELPMQRELFWFLVALALFIIYTHRGNIQRLREGRENRLEKAMLWRRPR